MIDPFFVLAVHRIKISTFLKMGLKNFQFNNAIEY